MGFDQDKTASIAAALKMVYKHQNETGGVHRNVVRKRLLADKKISSKTKFAPLIDSLIALDVLRIAKKEMLSINNSEVEEE